MFLTHTAQRETRLLSILRRELGMSSGLASRLKYCGAYTVNGAPAFTNHCVRQSRPNREKGTRHSSISAAPSQSRRPKLRSFFLLGCS